MGATLIVWVYGFGFVSRIMVSAILFAVSLRVVGLSSKISCLITLVLFVVWSPGQFSSMCSCVSFGSSHHLHLRFWYLFWKLSLASSILVLALNIVDVSALLSLFM